MSAADDRRNHAAFIEGMERVSAELGAEWSDEAVEARHATDEAVIRLHAEAIERERQRTGVSPLDDPRTGLMPWQIALLKRIAVMSEDERLIIAMPHRRVLAEPVVYKVVLPAQDQQVSFDDIRTIEERLAHPEVWMLGPRSDG